MELSNLETSVISVSSVVIILLVALLLYVVFTSEQCKLDCETSGLIYFRINPSLECYCCSNVTILENDKR